MDLTGTWRARSPTRTSAAAYVDDGFDDSTWEHIEVPGHWRSTPAFSDADGPLLYRDAFEADGASDGDAGHG